MTVRPTTLRAYRLALVLALPLAAACGGDGGTPAEDTVADTRPDVEALPTLTAHIEASTLSGNAPLTVTFSVDVGGVEDADASGLLYRWTIDGAAVGDGEPTLEFPFYRAGASNVKVEVEYRDALGRSVVAADTVVVRVQGCAELTFDRLTLDSPVDVAPGDSLRIKFATLFNEGDAIEADFDVAVALSADDQWDPDDRELGRFTVRGLASGLFSESSVDFGGRTVDVPEDVAEGDYYVFIVADPDGTVNECQETNNAERSTNNVTVDLAAADKPDLVLRAVGFGGTTAISQGDALSYSYTLANEGPGGATQFRVGFWLSTDQVLDPDTDVLVASPDDDSARVQSLPAGASFPFLRTYRVPDDLPDGDYWLIGQVDVRDQVTEADEGNNVTVSASQVTMAYEVPTCFDLGIARVVVEPLATYWNGSIQLTVDVANTGTQPTPDAWTMRAFLSQQQSLNPANARIVGEWTLGSVPAGETRTFERTVPISSDLPVLPHYAGVVLDPEGALEECNESNNGQLFGSPITINAVASVDLDVGPIAFHPATVAAGGTLKLEYDVQNHGTSGATAFDLGVVLSPDPVITRASVKSGADILIARRTVTSVPANGTLPRIDDVVIPVALDHLLDTYYVGVLADVDGIIGQDSNTANNVELAPGTLTVTGAEGGCYEDAREDDDVALDATALAAGTVTDLGSCGDDDWFTVAVPARNSLLVEVDAEPVAAVVPVESELVVELYDEDGELVAASDADGGHDRVRAFAGDVPVTFTLRVAGRLPTTRAHYAVTTTIAPPPDAADLLVYDVSAAPAALYPGGRLHVGWTTVNTGLTAAPASLVRVWMSQDRALSPATDVVIGEIPAAALPSLGADVGGVDLLLPATLSGGDWYAIVAVDADDAVVEADETQNVESAGPIYLDPEKVCEDDADEPNDEVGIARPLAFVDGQAVLHDRVVCPDLPDWYSVTLGPGEWLDASVTYTYASASGLLQLELWDPSKKALLYQISTSGTPRVQLPWTFFPGTYYLAVSNKAVGANIGPYTYTLTATVTGGVPEAACVADPYEDNNGAARAKPLGCGVLQATLCRVDQDWYLLDAEEGVQVDLTMTNALSQTRLRIFADPALAPVKTRIGNGLLSHVPDRDGLLWVAVDPRNGPLTMTEYPYTLAVSGIAGVDLTTLDLAIPTPAVTRGEDVSVRFTTANACTDDAGPFVVRAWLSLDPARGEDDVALATFPLASGLAAGVEVPFDKKVRIPASTLPGDYYVIVAADGDDAVAETNEANNGVFAPLHVDDICTPDALEPNDFPVSVAATPLVAPPGVMDLAICPNDIDWFRVEVEAGRTVTVTASFDNAVGDLDVRLYDLALSATSPAAESATSEDDEVVTWYAPVATTLLVRVAGFAGASAPYDLWVTVD
ncbi:MAG: pre-peptidase C-terminal domain-containing protein [Myxococcales bacterium]|nr:pre-peptidase C-terminal domain-containing protein [Myxococcales bacterium]